MTASRWLVGPDGPPCMGRASLRGAKVAVNQRRSCLPVSRGASPLSPRFPVWGGETYAPRGEAVFMA
jgi:hypothetical protein